MLIILLVRSKQKKNLKTQNQIKKNFSKPHLIF
jgi:hypothetical protein